MASPVRENGHGIRPSNGFAIERPRVGVLTIGEEAGKGNAMVKAACALLEEPEWAAQCDANYVGNIEGGDLMAGVADVIVCDGFTGNVTLKSLEGFYDIFRDLHRTDHRVGGRAGWGHGSIRAQPRP